MNLDRLLVKAKRVDNGEWIEGHYVYRTCWDEKQEVKIGMHQIHVDPQEVGNIYLFEIDPEIICQCSAETDYVDTFIFDNDMLYKDGKYFGYARFNEKYLKWEIVLANNKHGKTTALATHCKVLTVTGNIHDSKGE